MTIKRKPKKYGYTAKLNANYVYEKLTLAVYKTLPTARIRKHIMKPIITIFCLPLSCLMWKKYKENKLIANRTSTSGTAKSVCYTNRRHRTKQLSINKSARDKLNQDAASVERSLSLNNPQQTRASTALALGQRVGRSRQGSWAVRIYPRGRFGLAGWLAALTLLYYFHLSACINIRVQPAFSRCRGRWCGSEEGREGVGRRAKGGGGWFRKGGREGVKDEGG